MGAGGELDEAALATTVDATEGLEQDIEQLLQSVAGMKGPGGPADGAGAKPAASSALPDGVNLSRVPRDGVGQSAADSAGLGPSINFGQASNGGGSLSARSAPSRHSKLNAAGKSTGRSAKQRLHSIKSQQGAVSTMPSVQRFLPAWQAICL